MEMNVRRKSVPCILVEFGSVNPGEVFSFSDGGALVNKNNLFMKTMAGSYIGAGHAVRLCDGLVDYFAHSAQVFIPKNSFMNVQVD